MALAESVDVLPIEGLEPDLLQSALDPEAYLTVQVAQLVARASLPPYDVEVVRRTTHKPTESNHFGTYIQESVRYSDGAVRLVTIGIPNEIRFGSDGISPYPVISGDPLFTGPTGLNRRKLEEFVGLGFPVIWNHHQGRHALSPTNPDQIRTMRRFISTKSVGKSAHHDHVLINNVASSMPFRTDKVIRDGFSRSDMTGEAFEAISDEYDRTVEWSDMEAGCFARAVSRLQKIGFILEQLPDEIKGTTDQILHHSIEAIKTGDLSTLKEYVGIFDPNPLNVIHEVAWIAPLVNGDAGIYAKAVSLKSKGVRTFFDKDKMSQADYFKDIHSVRPDILILDEEGAHVKGAHPEYLHGKKYPRFQKVMDYIQANGDISGITYQDVVPEEQVIAALALRG